MNRRVVIYKGCAINLTIDDRGLWVDAKGCVYGFREEKNSVDSSNACGVWPVRLPEGSPLDKGCGVHDYMYSSPAYQYFNTRKEADDYMRHLHKEVTKNSVFRLLVAPFHEIARWVGGRFWENKKTR